MSKREKRWTSLFSLCLSFHLFSFPVCWNAAPFSLEGAVTKLTFPILHLKNVINLVWFFQAAWTGVRAICSPGHYKNLHRKALPCVLCRLHTPLAVLLLLAAHYWLVWKAFLINTLCPNHTCFISGFIMTHLELFSQGTLQFFLSMCPYKMPNFYS